MQTLTDAETLADTKPKTAFWADVLAALEELTEEGLALPSGLVVFPYFDGPRLKAEDDALVTRFRVVSYKGADDGKLRTRARFVFPFVARRGLAANLEELHDLIRREAPK
jgi:hypothetical protein